MTQPSIDRRAGRGRRLDDRTRRALTRPNHQEVSSDELNLAPGEWPQTIHRNERTYTSEYLRWTDAGLLYAAYTAYEGNEVTTPSVCHVLIVWNAYLERRS